MNEPKINKPATPMPWEICGAMNSKQLSIIRSFPRDSIEYARAMNGGLGHVASTQMDVPGMVAASTLPPQMVDFLYMVHAAHSYPRLVEALRELTLRCDGAEGVRADGSNIQTMQANALLRELTGVA